MADVVGSVKTVIQILNDGAKGFADIGEKIQDVTVKQFFVSESSTRSEFAQELEAAAGVSSEVRGTAAGAVHRTWADLKAKLGGGDHSLLETAEQGEDAAKKAYQLALEDTEVTGGVRALLQEQQAHIQASHDKVKAFRDARA